MRRVADMVADALAATKILFLLLFILSALRSIVCQCSQRRFKFCGAILAPMTQMDLVAKST